MSTHSPGERVSGKIVKTIVREIGQKDAVEVRCELPDGEIVGALIYLTAAAASMARSQLKACGFDCDTQSLAKLAADDLLLAGVFVDLESEEYNGKIQWRLRTAKPVAESRLYDYDAMLRGAKNREAPPFAPQTAPAAIDDLPF